MFTQALYGPDDKYLRTICFGVTFETRSAALEYCQTNGMDLLDISDESTKTALLAIIEPFIQNPPPGVFYVVYVKGEEAGLCQQVTTANGFVEVNFADCEELKNPICGFVDPSI